MDVSKNETKIECKDLVKKYGNTEVLKSVNLELEKGKIYGLIGRNGVGKTTLLSILSAQNPATAGSISLNGMPIWENQDSLDHICFSRELNPASGNASNAMKVKEYLKIASIYLPGWDKEMEKYLIQEFELDVKKKIGRLSKGMMSMVTIIVALASKADFTFLDEPVAGLDVVMREAFYRILLEEFSESGRTFVVSTHIIEEAADVFEEVIILDKGKVVLKENTQDLLERVVHISGKEEVVDEAIKGKKGLRFEKMGRSKGATVMLEKGEKITAHPELTVQPMSLQQIFVALCGKEATK